jgi:hypothetical protein
MRVAGGTLGEFTTSQLRGLCEVVGIEDRHPVRLLEQLLSTAASRPLTEPPLWPSDVADDATPIEFSVQFDDNGQRHLRILAETIAAQPSASANLQAAQEFLDNVSREYDLALDRLRSVQELFLAEEPQGKFAWWYSFIFSPGKEPKFKVYFNPEVHGPERSREIVADSLDRLGLHEAYQTVEKYALQRGDKDHFAFFAVDLDHSPQSRVKIYVAQEEASAAVAERAAAAVPGIDPGQAGKFCSLLGGDTEIFAGRPLVSSYSFVEGDTSTPSNYSVYVPIRDYVPHDGVARERVLDTLPQFGVEPTGLDEMIAAVRNRPLEANSGLIAHVSLRMSASTIGSTVYLSSEAYGGTPR